MLLCSGLIQKDLFRKVKCGEVLKHNFCHACRTFFPLPSCYINSPVFHVPGLIPSASLT